MEKLILKTVSESLVFENRPEIFSGDIGSVTLKVNFDETWDGFGKTAVFSKGTETPVFKVLDINGECIIPSEILADPGKIYIGVFGVKDEKTITSELIGFKIGKGVDSFSAVNPQDEPDPDVYQQIVSNYGKAIQAINQEIADRESAVSGVETEVSAVNDKVPFGFGIDVNNNYGYIPVGGTNIVPFGSGSGSVEIKSAEVDHQSANPASIVVGKDGTAHLKMIIRKTVDGSISNPSYTVKKNSTVIKTDTITGGQAVYTVDLDVEVVATDTLYFESSSQSYLYLFVAMYVEEPGSSGSGGEPVYNEVLNRLQEVEEEAKDASDTANSFQGQITEVKEDLAQVDETLGSILGYSFIATENNSLVRGNDGAFTITRMDEGYIRVHRPAGYTPTRYQGLYIKIPYTSMEDLDKTINFSAINNGDSAFVMRERHILSSVTDWGGGQVSTFVNGDNLKTLFENSKFPAVVEKIKQQGFFYVTLLDYTATTSTNEFDYAIRFLLPSDVKATVSFAMKAESATIAGSAVTAESANKSDIAKNAGFEYMETSKAYTSIGNSEGSYWEKSNKEYTIHIAQIDESVFNVQVNHTFGFSVKEMFGKGVKLKFDIHNSNYSGNLSTSWYFNNVHISQDYAAWGRSVKNITGIDMGNVDSSFTIDLDSLGIDYEKYEKLYFVMGAFERHQVARPYNPPTNITIKPYILYKGTKVFATDVVGFDVNNYYNKAEVDAKIGTSGNYITTWGDSLTAGGGWNTLLASLAGMTLYNGGTGGENARTIVARQGADAMIVNGITIPADTTPVTIARKATDGGILTEEGYKVTPLLQGGAHFNPCKIGDILGTLKWTGSSYADTNGTWTFARSVVGEEVVIDRPTAILTDFDMNKNAPYLAVIFIGQNGGYTDFDDLVRQHRLMIDHANAKHTIILGLSSGSATTRAEYESRMKKEFGRYFISLREYLAHPIYGSDGVTVVSCYGLADQGLEPNNTYTYNGVTYDAIEEIKAGIVPHMILADSVHYTSGTKTVIGNMLYKKCKELNIF